jgi:CheY-like chemotaxis protein
MAVRAKRLSPDVAMIDITMPELNGLEAARQIRREMPSVEVLILTMHDSDALIARALEAGARGRTEPVPLVRTPELGAPNVSLISPEKTGKATNAFSSPRCV